MRDLYSTLTSSQRINAVVNRHRALIDPANAIPVPVPFPDGRRRTASFRLLRMARLWDAHADETRASLSAYQGGDVVDVGAYHGWYSMALATRSRPGDRLLSLEPDAPAHRELLHTLAALANVFPDVRFAALPVPVGDGRALTVTHPEGSGHPCFASDDGPDGMPTVTVDGLVEQLGLRPAFVKVDVEGAEYYVLRGLAATLRGWRPLLMLELHPLWQPDGVTVDAVEALVEGHGYRRVEEQRSPLAVRQWWRPVT